jgi:phosphotransferase system  glucose/maltose/N-acetylglucosamine-specific IIC component
VEATTIVVTVDNAVSSGAIDFLNNNIVQLNSYVGSIRIILIAFMVWLIICVVYKFFNIFFNFKKEGYVYV